MREKKREKKNVHSIQESVYYTRGEFTRAIASARVLFKIQSWRIVSNGLCTLVRFPRAQCEINFKRYDKHATWQKVPCKYTVRSFVVYSLRRSNLAFFFFFFFFHNMSKNEGGEGREMNEKIPFRFGGTRSVR